MSQVYDVCVVGAGIVGMATAAALANRLPGIALAVVEKEQTPGMHQTGHNSGVVHSGLYYRPGSLKAILCVEGRLRMEAFCTSQGLPFARSGKVVVATTRAELAALAELERRGRANGLQGLERLDPSELRSIEPHTRGVAALLVPEAGVTDYRAVASRLAEQLVGDLLFNLKVERIEERGDVVEIGNLDHVVKARFVVNCAGLHADRVARLAGVDPRIRVVPFRGQYFILSSDASALIKTLVYPVPDLRFPFLGVHFTRQVDGSVHVGPNAVFAMGREHYRGAATNWRDVRESLAYPGFRRLARRYWRTGAAEMWRSLSTRSYARAARRLVPEVRAEHMVRGDVGVRAQAVSPDGTLQDDFCIVQSESAIHVINAPSPAATASLAIGEYLANRIAELHPWRRSN